MGPEPGGPYRVSLFRSCKRAGKVIPQDLLLPGSFAAHAVTEFIHRILDGRILSQKKRVRDKQKAVDGKRSELAESTKRKRVLERLKEQYREEYDYEFAKEEQTIIDDITSVRYKWSSQE